MNTHNDDVHLLVRRLDALTRTIAEVQRHLADLHYCGWERPTGDHVAVKETKTDHTPKAGDPRARELWSRISLQTGQVEATLIGLQRQLTGYFYAHSSNAEPSRGSLISRAEHDRLIANQRARRAAGEYTPAPLTEQPSHPSAGHADLLAILWAVVLFLIIIVLLRQLGWVSWR